MARPAINWKGDALKRKAEKAAMLGIDATMSAAIIHARGNHGGGGGRFKTRTSELERSIKIQKHARKTQRGVEGTWGSTAIVYARRIEFGFQGKDARGAVVNAPAFPFLRPAAQAEYPNLGSRIRRAGRFA